MNWYKISQSELKKIKDRNDFNNRIKVIEQTIAILSSMVRGIYENPSRSKKVISDMAKNKFFSSFPNLKELLLKADSKILDNHDIASEMISEVVLKLILKLSNMKKQRDHFLMKEYPIQFKDHMNRTKEHLQKRKQNGQG